MTTGYYGQPLTSTALKATWENWAKAFLLTLNPLDNSGVTDEKLFQQYKLYCQTHQIRGFYNEHIGKRAAVGGTDGSAAVASKTWITVFALLCRTTHFGGVMDDVAKHISSTGEYYCKQLKPERL